VFPLSAIAAEKVDKWRRERHIAEKHWSPWM
jgi:hypothetical protein